ncbi:CPA2 family monovalent cation:H+ antiporter-2 [Wenyingzhuangia heitensis]|uniref:CPA2 family monovalent cation:H+ antiporter-2 n=1 Tax=Wenyingzhuangia heitensis TaxID=1487859 RepID=A0ABX0UA13_9FLAO|nr:cation:proton antiporter [Wenyingzhuangia heitensis]NIJ44650.1 CPA2 family monovalent cation:H+ antiporter-2 [Wenyingzhuangia heitensis]
MLLLSGSNPNILLFVLIGFVVILLGAVLRHYKQPYVIAYILAGVLLGKHGFKIITNTELIESLGEFGLILILFFIGMEINLPNFIKKWKVAVFGTLLQILASILIVASIGYFFNWQLNRIIILGFVISLSSSAVIIKLLQDNNESNSNLGENIISILLMQDILIVPMLIAANYLGGTKPETSEIILQAVGGILLIVGIVWILKKQEITIPFSKSFESDHELQVFFAFSICFGFALLTSLFGLSAALGAFVAGMVVNSAKSTQWFHDSLNSFRIIFVALFFVSIGMLIDAKFILTHWIIISILLLTVYISNTFINAFILQYFEKNWKRSIYGGAMLAQIGELSFVLISTAYFANIITEFTYQLTIIITALTLLMSPFWIVITKKVLKLK